jgi:serine/threonine-protein kinase
VSLPAGDWGRLRALFDAVCDLPEPVQAARLDALCDDAALKREVRELLAAQTAAFGRALRPLGAAMADLAGTELEVGDRLGAWRLVERLASGGMGTVFVAERDDDAYRRRVAIKLLKNRGRAHAERLAGERQILAELAHPNIARLYDGGTTPAGLPYLVMEYVDGVPLDRYCRERALDLDARLALFLRIARTVQAAHARLVIHCDLKPANVLVRADGEPVLLDFGVARTVGADADGEILCTPAYASPEQLAGRALGTASDVFSLGVLLVELLAAAPVPRPAGDAPLPRPSALADAHRCPWRARLRGDLDAIAAKACAVDPQRRYASAEALADDLERHRRRLPVRARAPTAGYRLGRFVRRHARPLAAAAALAVLLAVFVARLVAERERARLAAARAEQVGAYLVSLFTAADPRANGGREPGVRDVLDRGRARIEGRFAAEPALRARLLETLGSAYAGLGQPRTAVDLLERAAADYARPDVADAEAELRVRVAAVRQHVQAKALERADAASAAALAFAREHAVSAGGAREALAARLDALLALGRLDEAERVRGELCAAASAPADACSAAAAQLAYQRGRFDEAQALYRDLLARRRATLPPTHPDVLDAAAGYARSLRDLGRGEEAAAGFRDVIAQAAEVYGEPSAALVDLYSEYGSLLHDLGRYDEARAGYEHELALATAVTGAESPDAAVALNNLAMLAQDQGDLERALQLTRRSLAIRLATQPERSASVARLRGNLGTLLDALGRRDEAARELRESLAMRQALFGENHFETVVARTYLAQHLLEQGRLDAAQAEVDAIDASGFEPKRFDAMVVGRLRARIAARRGDQAAAVAQFRAVVALVERELGVDHPETARHRLMLAEALQAAGERAEAAAQASRAAPVLRATQVPASPQLARLARLEAALRPR